MRIWNDGPGRVVIVTHEQIVAGDPFAPTTRLGAVFADLIGAPVSAHFATGAVMPVVERRSMTRHTYGYDARDELAERRVIVVGREAADLLAVPAEPLMIWMSSRWAYAPTGERTRLLAPICTAAFPAPGARSTWWRDPENVEVARQWLEEQMG